MEASLNNLDKQINKNFYTIGIGTSAGGLQALKSFFDNLPSKFNHAIVIVQHLSPDYKSLMVELLSKNTILPIKEAVQEEEVKPGHVYLIPAKKNMQLKNGKLFLTDKPRNFNLNLPIDIFYESLAEEEGEHAIAIILSGTGSDGTRGMRSIKEHGGMLMVQSPDNATFDGMPNSAIATGLIDYVLPVEKIPDELINFIENPHFTKNNSSEDSFLNHKDFNALINIVKDNTGVDFSSYKVPTLVRRIIRRMSVNKCKDIRDYINYISKNINEAEILYREFLIGVTKFFRDDEAFEFLEKNIIPELFSNKMPRDTVKLWSVGCSTGEEAYSLAILLQEFKEKQNLDTDVKIFATDLDKDAIVKASKGVFTESIVGDVSEMRLKKYFVKKDDLYYINPQVRKMVIFSQHNAVQDPPLTKMDLITCRNFLIYLQPKLQHKLISSFHYSLNLDKFLFLGPSETTGSYSNALQIQSKKWKIYQNKTPLKSLLFNDRIQSLHQNNSLIHRNRKVKENNDQKLAEILSETVLEEFSAASAYIDNDFELVSADGELRNFFQFPEKKIRSFNILKILPNSISVTLSTAIRKANSTKNKIIYKGIEYYHPQYETRNKLTLIVKPISSGQDNIFNLFLVLFINQDFAPNINVDTQIEDEVSSFKLNKQRISLLEQELLDTKANLQAMVEEVETSNEELQATNEELLASNEELQSTNEELQSVNEELYTVNAEHQEKIDEVIKLNEDLENLITSTNIGTIFLDKKLRIQKFTPAVKKIFNLIQADIGRPLSHFNTTLGEKNEMLLENSIKKVIESGETIEKEIQFKNQYYIKRSIPYKDNFDNIKGCIISFIDITQQKHLENELQHANKFLNDITDVIPSIIYIYNQKTNTNEYANKELTSTLGYTKEDLDLMGSNILGEIFHPDDLKNIDNHFKKIRNGKEGIIHELEYRVKKKDGDYVWLLSKDIIYERIPRSKFVKHIGVSTDITNIKEIQHKLEEANLTYNTVVEGTLAGYWDWLIQENYEYMSPSFKAMFGYGDDEIPNTPDWWQANIHPEDLPGVFEVFEKHVKTKGKFPYDNEVRYYHKDGSIVWVKCTGKVIEWNAKGEPIRMVGSHIDITDLKNKERSLIELNNELDKRVKERTEELRVSEKKFHDIYDYSPDMFLSVSPKDASVIECNETLLTKLGYSRKEVIGKSVFNLYHPDSHKKANLAFELFKKEGEVRNAELTLITKSKEKIEVSLNVSAVKDKNDNVLFSISSWRDVSELNEAIKDLEELTYVTTHDLKAPINNINSFLSLLKEDTDINNKDSQEAIDWIEQNVNKAELTLKNLLSVTKARALVLENISTINLENAITEVKQNLSFAIQKTNATITYDVSKCESLKFSKVHLISMLQNVIGNALKYKHPDREPIIQIESTFDNTYSCISISDNGIGIDMKEHKERVFGLFKRANDDTKGSGLALYIIKKVLEKTGGKIEVKSKVDKGSTFYLYFKK